MTPGSAMLYNLLRLTADKGALGRLQKLVEIEQRAAGTEAAFAEKRAAFEQRKATAGAELARMANLVGERRDLAEFEEGSVEVQEQWLIEQEAAWSGLGMPDEAPQRALN